MTQRLPWAWFRHGLISIMWSAGFKYYRIGWGEKKLIWGSRIRYGIYLLPRNWWIHVWLPKWCKGRGYYISIGLWLFSIHRGY